MGFDNAMKKMCEDLGTARAARGEAMEEFYSSCESDLSARGKEIVDRKHQVNRLAKDVHVIIQHFHTERGKMSEELEAMLEKCLQEIQKFVHDLARSTHGMMKGFHTDRKKMAEEMRGMLEEFTAANAKEVGALLKQAQGFMKECHSQHQAMSEELREELAGFCKGLEQEVSRMKKETGQMRKGFQQAHKDLHAEMLKAHQMYQEFAAGRGKKTHKPMVEQPKQAKPKADIHQEKLLGVLEGSSNGMTKKELVYAMGMQEEALGRLLSQMLKRKMIRKRKNVYHAA